MCCGIHEETVVPDYMRYVGSLNASFLFLIPTIGDIGETAPIIEKNLEKNFQLAHKWGCVLLLDEADVFLAKRGGDDMQRNSLVSGMINVPAVVRWLKLTSDLVFLRVLEYYSGILFLTTNRVGMIDPAFKSRIHISLYYPPLDEESTMKVWAVNIERIKANAKRYVVDEREILEFAAHHYRANTRASRWNGRQIRNAFQTAIALAEYDVGDRMRKALEEGVTSSMPEKSARRARLTREHFNTVAVVSSHFDHYIKEVYGGRDEADRARDDSMRRDDWGESFAQIRPPYSRSASPGLYRPAPQRPLGQDVFNYSANNIRVPSAFEESSSFDESIQQTLSEYVVRRPSSQSDGGYRQTQKTRHGSTMMGQLNRAPPNALGPDAGAQYQQPLGSHSRANSQTMGYGRPSIEIGQDFAPGLGSEYDEQRMPVGP
ncbi:hypothetical protein GP486_000592 [Trichoglossum hirsutum]|uniref:ATPase AAA-type core domain-containing protein n=1 Tax=Trichoglossum hirsutum TaxID=265104 RepID=A0A9P8LI98_9PEZI|nr:hypothetical protein GP486_000592 [Trichoglossum hirsutum]